jgi:hypothetical protein
VFGENIEPLNLGNVWPVLLALLWRSWWPALDWWAGKRPAASGPWLPLIREPVWWAEWHGKWGILVAILVIGYGLIWSRRRY